jgi:uracil phosphoribosyltransferase
MASLSIAPQQVTVCRHPLLESALAVIRSQDTHSAVFRVAMEQIAVHLILSATQNWPTIPALITTPLTTSHQQVLDPHLQIWLVPILRAGLALCPAALEWLPQAKVYHLGLARDESTLQPVVYYNNLPKQVAAQQPLQVLIVDPMLATGGSAQWAIQTVLNRGVPQSAITLLVCLAAPEGIALLTEAFPDIRIVTAALDERLNEQGYIVPGLGDAGDRFFGT